ncbi:hypothetical protein [Geminicoccus flavidas]|uniref:hypothetical protein n=1 Tax=Geminicoccus flavidas TaxID=2506407 RepID=UPI00135AF0A3|nr:hypothetical protein [Geminicoccus flavidas]
MTAYALFIGGPVDGRREILREAFPSWEVALRPEPPTSFPIKPDPAADVAIKRETYRLVQTSAPNHYGQTLCLYVHSSIGDWLAHMIEAYPKGGRHG